VHSSWRKKPGLTARCIRMPSNRSLRASLLYGALQQVDHEGLAVIAVEDRRINLNGRNRDNSRGAAGGA